MIEGIPINDFGKTWVDEWRLTSNYAIWMSLTDQELFDIIEPRHPCSGTATLSLEDVQLRIQQKMQDLKIDEKMASSKEAISRTWVSGSSKVRGAVGSALAGIDQYRAQRKPASPIDNTSTVTDSSTTATNGAKKESFVSGWAAWAAEKRKKAFQKEEPPKIERPDIGPAPARPLAQWAKRSSETSSSGKSLPTPGQESVRSSTDTRVEGTADQGEKLGEMESVKL